MRFPKKYLSFILITLSFLCLCGCHDIEPIENLSVITGFGYDIEKNKDNEPTLISAIEFVSIENKQQAESDFYDGKGNTIYSSVESYKAKQGKPFRYGSELLYMISEERARFGIEDVIADLVGYPHVNINAKMLICKGKAKDYFSLENASANASEQLSNIVKFENQEYYFSQHYSVNDFLCMYYQKGRNIYLPYVEIKNESPKLSGVAIFNKDKLIKVLPIDEANLINLIRNSNGNGIISVTSEKPLEYLELEGKNKTKVEVSKENNKLKFDIIVTISGGLRIDTLYRKEFTKDQIKQLQKTFEEKIKKDIEKQIEKVQKEYRIDCLDLGRYALAKYGKNSGFDSEEYFTNAEINVDVKVKIKSTGRVRDSSRIE